MRFIYLVFLATVLLSAAPDAHAQGAIRGGTLNVPARLVAESDTPAPGQTVTLAFVMSPKPGWHGYWENPGDAGVGMALDWDLPAGVKAGPLRYPVPERLLISGLMNYVYEGDYALLVDLGLPKGLKHGDMLSIRVHGEWLSCTREICVPESGDMALDLIVGKGRIMPERRAAFDQYRARLPRPLDVGGLYAVEKGSFRLGIPYPDGAAAEDAYFFPLTDEAIVYSAPQRISRSGNMLIVETEAAGSPDGRISGILKTAEHEGLFLSALPGRVPASREASGDDPKSSLAGSTLGGVLFVLGGALLGGLLLNVMPCVFPILSLKALKLAKAGGDETVVRRDSIAYAAGAVATCLALGLALIALRAGGAAVGWAFQLQDPRIIMLLLVLVTAIALNLAGLFELRNIGAGGELAAQGGAAGSFWTGALAAFVATPCTGPFMGAALGTALVLPIAAAVAIFAGLGIGLALPFLLIAFIPALRGRLPRPGPWMETFRRILSVPMFATALALVWLLGRQAGTAGMTAGLGAALTVGLLLWWLGTRQRRGRRRGPVFAATILLVSAGLAAALPQTRNDAVASRPRGADMFSEAKLADLRAQKRPVFLYFTADWCITCKANEVTAIRSEEVTKAFARADVAVLVGDWTNGDATIGRFLERHGRTGVPLYLWYAPGEDVRVLPQILRPTMLADLAS